MTSMSACQGWVCQFQSGRENYKLFKINKGKILEEEVTEEPMGGSEDEETSTSDVGIWLVVGLSLGLSLVLGIAIKKILKWFRKDKNTMSYFILVVENIFFFRVRESRKKSYVVQSSVSYNL